jgi:uncharacterized protein
MSLPLVILFLGGVFGGFFGSMVGSAGLVSLPLLILLGQTPHQAVATSRPAALILELVSALRYGQKGKIGRLLLNRGSLLGIAGAAGGMIGSFVIAGVSDQTLRLMFAIVISSMFALVLTKKEWGSTERPALQNRVVPMLILTMLSGIYGGFFGFTFGTVITFVLVTYGYTLVQSAALSRVIGVFTTFSSTLVFVYQGTIRWDYALVLGAGFATGAWLGAGIGASRGNRFIKILLSCVVTGSVLQLLLDFWRGV